MATPAMLDSLFALSNLLMRRLDVLASSATLDICQTKP
ncbi:hypothetical protein BN2497_5007 [Janthinobacterium sp. CG23_2]|nr:hypothetical protein BN2497_5007 [Janthinobacterium sp. CG23_2]CUU28901.1 hypothetical protein BN3177_5007 [Janthinobacterium sp. CG23_2]